MRDAWVDNSLRLAALPADFFSGSRKILRNQHLSIKRVRNDLRMEDLGYTKSKTTMLIKNYVHEESKQVAIDLWEKRLGQRKYGSVGFTCYNHFVKGGSIDAKRSKRASVFGPCIQSVNLTYLEKDKACDVDVFYRTTEFFKKFPADLVFIRDQLLSGFRFDTAPIKAINFHFANVTIHPMYFVTLMPHLGDAEDIITEMETLRAGDQRFFDWCVKWTARYIIPDYHRGIQKFAQAMRVKAGADAMITGKRRDLLIDYLKENHPGYRSDYIDPDLEEEDDGE